MPKVACRSQPETPEIDDDYVESVLSKNYVGELEKNRELDRKIEKEKAARIELYRERLSQGLEIFSCKPLSEVDLISVRGYGDMRLGTALNKIRAEDKKKLLHEELDLELS